jgi:TolB-like protein/regulator of sirC expression with transglutaminase-like and TPR domain
MTPDIFLSYTREDSTVAQAYRDAFAREGLDVWWDATLHSGEDYDQVTEEALRTAKAVVVLWSPRSVASRWVRAEATIAYRNKTLTPVMIEPCERPVMFELTQTAELSHWRGAADDPAWLTFLGDVGRRVGREPVHPIEASPTAASTATAAGSSISNVALLPITHRGNDEQLELLAEDLTEEVTRELAQSDYFKVIAASTMSAWHGKEIDNQVLGRRLEARYLIEAKLQRVGSEAVRLTAQVVETDTANCVWSRRFEGPAAAEMADAKEDFATVVAAELGEQILQIEMKRAMAKPAPHSAWEHLLRFWAFGSRWEPGSALRALEEARNAVAAAPDLAVAHSAAARAIMSTTVGMGIRINDVQLRELHMHIDRALQLDGDKPSVIIDLTFAYVVLGDLKGQMRLAQRAVELRPKSPRAYFALGGAYLGLGRTSDAIAAYTEQLGLRGYDSGRSGALTMLGLSYLLEEMPAKAEEVLDRSLTLHPKEIIALMFKAIAAAQLGKETAAIATMRQLRDSAPNTTIDQCAGFILQNPRISHDIVSILRRLWEASEGGP